MRKWEFGVKEADGNEEMGSRIFLLLEDENLCVSFPVFGWQLETKSEKVYCVFRCLVSNVEVEVEVGRLTTKLTVK